MTIPRPLQAILFTVAAMACFAVMSTSIRALSAEMQSLQMVFLRNLISLVLIMALILACRKPGQFRTNRPRSHLLRSTTGFAAMEMWFYSLTQLPLNVATALSFTTPVFGAICAIWLLKEKAGWRRWSAIVTGFAGVLIILRPGGDLNALAPVVLASSCLMALSGTAVKSLTRTESPETIVFYMALFLTVFSIVPGVLAWQEVSLRGLGLAFLIALSSTVAQLSMAQAYRRADMVTLLPLDFLRLVFTAAMAWLFFSEKMDHYTLIGAGVILVSSIYIVHREALKRQEKISPPPD